MMKIYLENSGSAWHDETIDIPNGGLGQQPWRLEWGQNGGTISGNSQRGNAGITKFPETWYVVLEAWYSRQAGME